MKQSNRRQNYAMKPTFNAYIDGFNLYKGSLERRPECKWLDIVGLCKSLELDANLDMVFYFTAPVKSRFVGDRALIITGDSDLTVPILFTKAEGVTANVVVPGDG